MWAARFCNRAAFLQVPMRACISDVSKVSFKNSSRRPLTDPVLAWLCGIYFRDPEYSSNRIEKKRLIPMVFKIELDY